MLIGLAGFKGSGKNTAADYLTKEYGFEQLSFAAKLKESAAALFDIDPARWDYLKNDSQAKITLDDPVNFSRITVTAREFLQRYGTESHRNVFWDSFWVDLVLPPGNRYSTNTNMVVSDVRFENEVSRVKE